MVEEVIVAIGFEALLSRMQGIFTSHFPVRDSIEMQSVQC